MKKMTNIIITILIGISLVFPSFSYAGTRSSNIIEWTPYTVKKGFILSNETYYKKMCSKTWSKQIPEFLKRNPKVKDANKFWPGDKIMIQTCGQLKPVVPVVSWSKVTTTEEFVLTSYLKEKSGCGKEEKDLNTQMKEFKTHNPSVANIDRIPAGSSIEVQKCDIPPMEVAKIEVPVSIAPESMGEEVAAAKKNVVVESKVADEDDVVSSEVVEDIEEEESGTITSGLEIVEPPQGQGYSSSSGDQKASPTDDTILFGAIGFLSEGKDETDLALGARYKTNVYPQVEYAARIDASQRAIYFNHQINFISLQKENSHQYFIGIGLGQRYAIKDEVLSNNQGRSIEMYPFAALGYRKSTKKGYVEAQIGSNLASQKLPNISVIGMKRLGSSDYMLGLYGDWRNSKSPINNVEEPLKYFTGGVIFSY